jgi:hypothetical protein
VAIAFCRIAFARPTTTNPIARRIGVGGVARQPGRAPAVNDCCTASGRREAFSWSIAFAQDSGFGAVSTT